MLTQKNKRFLIIWFSVCFSALLCNIAPITGEIQSEDFNNGKPRIHLLTNQGYGFWPFSTEFRDSRWWDDRDYVEYAWRKNGPLADANGNIRNDIPSEFNGIFNGFDYLEFLVYGIIGLAIVYVPKVWN